MKHNLRTLIYLENEFTSVFAFKVLPTHKAGDKAVSDVVATYVVAGRSFIISLKNVSWKRPERILFAKSES